MAQDATTHELPTRRDFVKGGGTIVGGGLLAGCAGDDDPDTTDANGSYNPDTTDANSSYTVTMAPVGEVTFDSVPESAFVVDAQYADMAVALGHGEAVNSLFTPEFFSKTLNKFYDRLDGVNSDWTGLPDPLNRGMPKELFYELDSDVHFVDPAWISTRDEWNESDITEIEQNIGPWMANRYSGQHNEPPEEYRDTYQYYTLWELFEKISHVFQEPARYDALATIHTDLLSTIQSRLPPKDERPTVARVTLEEDSFYVYHLNDPGFQMADTRPLGANDPFAELSFEREWGTLGYEAMLEADPDIILHLWGLSPGFNVPDTIETIKSDPVGRQLSAIQNDHFYASGTRRQGPITNFFQLEMTAKQLYPEQFGEWPGYVVGESYPDFPADEQLFDRQRVADIINGEF